MHWCNTCGTHTENRQGPLYRRLCDECGTDRDE